MEALRPSSQGSQVTFCGMELTRAPYGWVTQREYLLELLQRYGVVGGSTSPLPKWEEPPEEKKKVEGIRRAHGITGALLWAVTRSRPDIAFAVLLMAQQSTKTPDRVYDMGIQVLRYSSATLDLGLEYRLQEGPSFGSEGQSVLQLYARMRAIPWEGRGLGSASSSLGKAQYSYGRRRSRGLQHFYGRVRPRRAYPCGTGWGVCVGPIMEELIEDDVVISPLRGRTWHLSRPVSKGAAAGVIATCACAPAQGAKRYRRACLSFPKPRTGPSPSS